MTAPIPQAQVRMLTRAAKAGGTLDLDTNGTSRTVARCLMRRGLVEIAISEVGAVLSVTLTEAGKEEAKKWPG